ncbi:hypothetical protein HDU91_006102 [Kappamyces sp. JEL0680]|nr:hypothetical protein HDU91_006102 [Kappamyces sp. JEL0680]
MKNRRPKRTMPSRVSELPLTSVVAAISKSKKRSQFLMPHLTKLASMSFFVERQDLFRVVSPHFTFESRSQHEWLVKEGEPFEDLFWLLEGHCAVSTTIDLVSDAANHLRSYTAGAPILADENILRVVLDIQDLYEGDWGPYIPETRQCGKYSLLSNTINLCDYSIKCETNVVVARIPLSKFLGQIPTSVVKTLQTHGSSIFRFAKPYLQQEFLENAQYKHRLAQVVSVQDEASLVLDESCQCINKT